MADVIINSLARCFYKSNARVLGSNPHTEKRFQSLTGNVIAWVATCCRHAISEYEHGGEKQTITFEGHVAQGTIENAAYASTRV